MKCKKYVYIILILSLILSSPVIPLTSAEEDLPVVGEYGDYEWEAEAGEKRKFNWTVEKPEDLDFTINLEIKNFEGAETSISPKWFILRDENPVQIVTLTVEIPRFPEEENIGGSVVFNFNREGETIDSIEKEVDINVIGIPEAPEANTIVGGFENPLPSPLDGPIGAFILNLAIWFMIGVASYFIVTPFLKKIAKKTKTDFDEILLNMVRRPLLIFIFIYGFIHSLLRFDMPVAIRANLYQIYSLVALLIGVYVTYQIFDGFLKEIASRRGGESAPFGKVIKPIFEKIGTIIIFLGGLIIGLSIMGIEVTALLAGAGVLGLVVAFAAQDTLSNFFSGIHLLLDRPFTIGDVLELESGEFCRVENVGMRSTKLYDIRSHELVVLPNNAIANQKIKNLAEPDRKIRTMINVGVAYGSDVEKVKEILYEVLEEEEGVVVKGEFDPVVRFTEFGDSSLQFQLRFWVEDYLDQWEISSNIRDKINEEFREAEVTIPFPQRTVWLEEKKD